MTQSSRGRGAHVSVPKKLQETETSAEKKTRILPQKQQQGAKKTEQKTEHKAPVIYYLSRNGQLEHPHFMEVPFSSSQGPHLKDVMKRLDFLRGQGMSGMYSWSAKRSYKSGYVWQDLSEDDLLPACHGNEYVLKGSRLLESSQSFRSCETALSSSFSSQTSKNSSSESYTCSEDSTFLTNPRRKNKSKSKNLFDGPNEYKVYKVETDGEFAKKAANAATQTEEKGRQEGSVEIEEIALPLSTFAVESFSESADIRDQSAANDRPSGRIRASAVLMQLLSCGSKKGHENH